jgi:general secretion pathway protein I
MKPVQSVPRARPRGFSLIEVLAAMVIFSAGAVILFGWIAQTADRLGRLGAEQQTLFAQLAGLDFIRTLNPMQRPSGEALIGSTTVRWQAKPVGDESAVREGNGAGRYVVRLYQVRINTSNARDAGAEQSVYLAGWRELPARAPLGADTIPAPPNVPR